MNVEHVVLGAAGGIGCPAAVRAARALELSFVYGYDQSNLT